MKTLISVSCLMFLLTISALSAVITVSDLGQPPDQTNTLCSSYSCRTECTRLHLVASETTAEHWVYVVVERRGWNCCNNFVAGQIFIDASNGEGNAYDLTKITQHVIGPIRAGPAGIDVKISATVKSMDMNPNPPPIFAIDVVGLAIGRSITPSTNVSFAGSFPIMGSAHTMMWTNPLVAAVQINGMQMAPEPPNKYNRQQIGLYLGADVNSYVTYDIEASTNLSINSWERISGISTPGTNWAGWVGVLPPKYKDQAFFRLKKVSP